jgi:U3 small nucleolar ribonucleoprotein component
VLRGGDFNDKDYDKKDYVMDTPANMNSRMSIFYADFDEKHNSNPIARPLEVERDLVVKAVDRFLKFIRGKNYP